MKYNRSPEFLTHNCCSDCSSEIKSFDKVFYGVPYKFQETLIFCCGKVERYISTFVPHHKTTSVCDSVLNKIKNEMVDRPEVKKWAEDCKKLFENIPDDCALSVSHPSDLNPHLALNANLDHINVNNTAIRSCAIINITLNQKKMAK